ncbi:MAG TPA: hypothetical protein PLN21_02675 [Gemmatales bacterium]|nr:hypothetical protein [Gemmatales bacterium]
MKRKVLVDSYGSTSQAMTYGKTALVVVGTLLCSCLAWFLPLMLPFIVSERTSLTMLTISYNIAAYIVYLLVGGGMILASLKLGFERQLYHWLVLGGGIFVMVFGMLYVLMEKVEITQQGCYSRTWFGLSQTTLQFADLKEFKHIQEPRPAGASPKRPRPSQMVYITKNGDTGTFLASYYPTVLYNTAYGQLLLAWSLFSRGEGFPRPKS